MGRSVSVFACLACMMLGCAAVAHADEAPSWPDGLAYRMEALALLQTLNADLLSHDSATLTLERWCAQHRLAAQPRVIARLNRDLQHPPTAEQRKLLGVSDSEPVKYRHVQLYCGEHLLSEAENWYVPARLSAPMNQLLEQTDTAFGRAVQDLHFRRRTLSASLLWQPLPDGWEMLPEAPVALRSADAAKNPNADNVANAPNANNANNAANTANASAGRLQIPAHVLQHHAVLTTPDGTAFSEVIETYTSQVLAFAPLNFNAQP